MAFLSGKEAKIYLIVVLVLTIIALMVTMAVMLVRSRPQSSADIPVPQMEPTGINSLDPSRKAFQQLVLPEEFEHLYRQEWKPFRPVYESWTKEQAEAYWIDPEELVRKELESRTDREINEFFEDLP